MCRCECGFKSQSQISNFKSEILLRSSEEAYFFRRAMRDVGQQSLFDCQRSLTTFDQVPNYSVASNCSKAPKYFGPSIEFFRPSVETSTLKEGYGHPESSSYDPSLNRQSAIKNRQCLGGGEGTRTPDPRVANAVLCQLSYAPNKQFQRLVAGAGFEPATFGL